MQFLPTSFHTSDRCCKLTDSFQSNFTLTFFHWRQDVIIFHGELAKRSGINKYFLKKKKIGVGFGGEEFMEATSTLMNLK